VAKDSGVTGHKNLDRPGPNNFDAMRMAMALAVVWSHSFALYFGNEAMEPVSRLMNGATNAGRVAVYVFFAISGYLISQSFARSRSPWDFVKKRVARIYPGFLVATFICAFVILPLYVRGHYYTVSNVFGTIGQLLLLQNDFVATPFVHNKMSDLNASLWTIPYEFGCYPGVLALGIARLSPVKLKGLIAALLVVSIANHVLCEFDGTPVSLARLGPTVIPCFLAGACAYHYRAHLYRSATAALLGVLLLIVTANLGGKAGAVAFDVLVPPVVAYVTLMLAFADKTYRVMRLGDWSYGTYLYAWPIQQMVKASAGNLPFPVYVAVVISLSVACGALSWHLLEKWCRIGARLPRETRPGDHYTPALPTP
jgi:peptidoglycan/LPS O-acetylase OafA/YrhL